MLVHSVFFWLKNDVSTQEVEAFSNALEDLKSIKSAFAVYVGTPSTTERSVIDSSYSFALTVLFESMDDHNNYQVDSSHVSFLNEFKHLFARVQIYDAD